MVRHLRRRGHGLRTTGLIRIIVERARPEGQPVLSGGKALSAVQLLRDQPGCIWCRMTDDDSLMIRIQGGDARAFEELVERYQGQLIGFFFRNTRDAQLSEDLSQETLLRVYNQSWDYLPVGKFRGWMYRIGRNLLVDNVRRQSHDALIRAVTGARNEESDALARLAGEVLPPEELANEKELVRLLDRLLKDLPEEQRLTFVLHHYAELPLSEVAEIMETSVATSKSRLRLAREKLRDQLVQRGVMEGAARGRPD